MTKLAGFSIRLDPWSADYGSSLSSTAESEAILLEKVKIDASVEMIENAWCPIDCSSSVFEGSIAFVDGVRRIESNVIFESAAGYLYGAFGSCAAGAVVLRPERLNTGADSFAVNSVKRYLFAPSEMDIEAEHDLAAGYPPGASIPMIVSRIPGFDPSQPLAELQKLMRHEEAAVTERLFAESSPDLVIADGPLNVVLSQSRVAGFIKSLHSLYLPPSLYPLMTSLRTGERTPLFFIESMEPDSDAISRFACYIRTSEPGPQQSSLAGIARLEVPAEGGVDEAASILNACGSAIPKYASQFGRDPRAPQNLIPLSFVETELRRLMGNPEIMRRMFLDWMQKQQ